MLRINHESCKNTLIYCICHNVYLYILLQATCTKRYRFFRSNLNNDSLTYSFYIAIISHLKIRRFSILSILLYRFLLLICSHVLVSWYSKILFFYVYFILNDKLPPYVNFHYVISLISTYYFYLYYLLFKSFYYFTLLWCFLGT